MRTYYVWSMGKFLGLVVFDWKRPPFPFTCYFTGRRCYVQ